jgi:hypothetical protein
VVHVLFLKLCFCEFFLAVWDVVAASLSPQALAQRVNRPFHRIAFPLFVVIGDVGIVVEEAMPPQKNKKRGSGKC